MADDDDDSKVTFSEQFVAVVRTEKSTKGLGLKIIYLQCYFVTIATILGTGILGLPVTLSHAGIYPFLVTFITSFFIQVLLVFFFADLLQRCHAAQVQLKKEEGLEHVPLNEMEYDDIVDDDQDSSEGHVVVPADLQIEPANLHLLGQLFLSCGVRQLFDIILFVQFVAFLISYALAGSQAFAEVLHINFVYVIPVFVIVLSLAIVFCLPIIQPVVSILTFAKGSLLLATVVVTFFVGAAIHHDISNNFHHLAEPFLMGTVALGGVVNVMPFLYGKIQPVASQVNGFRTAILLGLTTCTILNILWCWAVLDIVPQTSGCFAYQKFKNDSISEQSSLPELTSHTVCTSNLSLESAAQNGEISTLPLTRIIHQTYPMYDWVALIVELFIMISITVSYLTIGATMHHTLCGWVNSLWKKDTFTSYVSQASSRAKRCCTIERVCQSTLSLMLFSVVLGIAMLNPQGFMSMLEKAASLFLNLEAGIFAFIMIHNATSGDYRDLSIPLPLPKHVYLLKYILPIYFGFAVGYDVYDTIYDMVYTQQDIVTVITANLTDPHFEETTPNLWQTSQHY